MVRRHELTDQAWAQIQLLLPRPAAPEASGPTTAKWSMGSCGSWPPGCPGGTYLNATGPGRPAMSGSAAGSDGTWQQLSPMPRPAPMRLGRWTGRWWSTRPSCAPTSTPPGPEKGGPSHYLASAPEADQALGRSRGGLTTKVHLACDGGGRPLAMLVTAGQRHESTQFGALLDAIWVLGPAGSGRPRKRPAHLIADRGYSYSTCRRLLRQRRIPHTIPRAVRPAGSSGSPGRQGRPAAESGSGALPATQRGRAGNRPAQATPRIATRYDKLAVSYHTWLVLAALLLWLPDEPSDRP